MSWTTLELEAPRRDRVETPVVVRRPRPNAPVRADGYPVELPGRRYSIPHLPAGTYTIEVRPADSSRPRPARCRGWDVDLASEDVQMFAGCGHESEVRVFSSATLRFTVTEQDAQLRPTAEAACGDFVVRVRPGEPSCFDRDSRPGSVDELRHLER